MTLYKGCHTFPVFDFGPEEYCSGNATLCEIYTARNRNFNEVPLCTARISSFLEAFAIAILQKHFCAREIGPAIADRAVVLDGVAV